MLHYSVELGFLQVAKTVVKKYPELLTVKTIAPKKKRGLLPVEVALINENHEAPVYLIRMIMGHERYNELLIEFERKLDSKIWVKLQ